MKKVSFLTILPTADFVYNVKNFKNNTSHNSQMEASSHNNPTRADSDQQGHNNPQDLACRFNARRAFEAFARRIGRFDDSTDGIYGDGGELTVAVVRRARLIRRLSIAAVSVAVVTSVAVYFYGLHHADDTAPLVTTFAVPDGSEGSTTLSDGTVVTLSGGSALSYDSHYGRKNRRVNLRGEGTFTVRHDSLCPFTVEAGGLRVTDLGTTFTVTAYHADTIQQVSLISGSASVENKTHSDLALTLNSGQTAVLNTRTGQLAIRKAADAGRLRLQNGAIVFEDMELQQITRSLEHIYGYRITITSPDLAHTRYYGTFNKSQHSLSEIMDMLQQAKHFNYNIHHHTVTITQ